MPADGGPDQTRAGHRGRRRQIPLRVYIGGQGLQTVTGLTIQPGGSKYQHESGSNGSYSFDAAQSLITFQGGALTKQAGKVEAGAKGGIIRLYNEKRSRTVIDCDSPRK